MCFKGDIYVSRYSSAMLALLYTIVMAFCAKFHFDPEIARREDSINWYMRHLVPRSSPMNWEEKPVSRESNHSHKNMDEEVRGFGSPVILRRIQFTAPISRPEQSFYSSDSLRDAVRGGNDQIKESKPSGWSIMSVVFFLVCLGISGGIGFYLGKIQESKNYIRIPSTN